MTEESSRYVMLDGTKDGLRDSVAQACRQAKSFFESCQDKNHSPVYGSAQFLKCASNQCAAGARVSNV